MIVATAYQFELVDSIIMVLIIFAILIIIGLILNKKRKERKFANQIIDAKIEEKRGENKWKQ